jgi:hypothetical protein
MKQECMRVENEIWDSIAEGSDLAEGILRHAQVCPECSRVLDEAKLSLRLLQCAAPYPETPDCREAVLARIGRTRRAWWPRRFAWAAASLTAVIVAGALILPMKPSHEPQPPRIAKSVTGAKPTGQVSGTSSRNTGVGKPVAAPEPKAAPPKRVRPTRRVIREIDRMALVPEAREEHVEASPAPPDSPGLDHSYYWDGDLSEGTMVAAVSVEWSAEPSAASLSYDFTEEDAATGTVTIGSVERSGNNIEITIESTPAEPDAPERGELSNEKIPAV